MTMNKTLLKTIVGFGCAISMGIGSQASAALITSIPGGSVVPMQSVNYFGPGPITFDGGEVTWSSTNAAHQGGSVFGYTNGYGFLSNGFWVGNPSMAGLNDSTAYYGVTDTMTFSFANPLADVGGLLNYVPGYSNPTTIAVYDSSHNLIESATLSFTTGGGQNQGQFLGFLENSPMISSLTLTDNYIGITNLTTTTSNIPITPTPIPAAVWMVGSALFGVFGFARKTTT